VRSAKPESKKSFLPPPPFDKEGGDSRSKVGFALSPDPPVSGSRAASPRPSRWRHPHTIRRAVAPVDLNPGMCLQPPIRQPSAGKPPTDAVDAARRVALDAVRTQAFNEEWNSQPSR
jgi:hypothetical protein